MLAENFWFEDEEVVWSFKLSSLIEVPKITHEGMQILAYDKHKKKHEKIFSLEHAASDEIEVDYFEII